MTNPLQQFLAADETRTQGETTQQWYHEMCEVFSIGDESDYFVAYCGNKNEDAAFIAASSRIANPLRELLRDYAAAVEALEEIQSIAATYQNETYHDEARRALLAAQKHADLLKGVK